MRKVIMYLLRMETWKIINLLLPLKKCVFTWIRIHIENPVHGKLVLFASRNAAFDAESKTEFANNSLNSPKTGKLF